jgi:hypothetical protein
VTKILDVKNKVTIITVFDDLFSLWTEFISIHSNRDLIDPDIGKIQLKQEVWLQSKFKLYCKSLKLLENLTEEDFENLPNTYATEV